MSQWDTYFNAHGDYFQLPLFIRPEKFPNEFQLNKPRSIKASTIKFWRGNCHVHILQAGHYWQSVHSDSIIRNTSTVLRCVNSLIRTWHQRLGRAGRPGRWSARIWSVWMELQFHIPKSYRGKNTEENSSVYIEFCYMTHRKKQQSQAVSYFCPYPLKRFWHTYSFCCLNN
jgi:hypothetical protein